MQNRYTADIGDWSKYGLLRALTHHAVPQMTLGVVWYLTPPDSNTDGQKIGYLKESIANRDRYAVCDLELYDGLRTLRTDSIRTGLGVDLVPRSGTLPPSTKYYSTPIDLASVSPKHRPAYRRQWLQGALGATENCDVVIFDPDNGLEIPSQKIDSATSGKYVFLEELLLFWERGQSLIIYQHTSRKRGGVAAQTRSVRCRLSRHLGINVNRITALRFRTQSSRTYFIVPSELHMVRLTTAVDSFHATPWVKLGHFVYD
jgi:hypothetical protein